MVNAELIYQKIQQLNAFRLQELADYLDFLLSKQFVPQKDDNIFPPTEIDWPDQRPVYQGRALSIEDMDAV